VIEVVVNLIRYRLKDALSNIIAAAFNGTIIAI
jgi:hypothetical protein